MAWAKRRGQGVSDRMFPVEVGSFGCTIPKGKARLPVSSLFRGGKLAGKTSGGHEYHGSYTSQFSIDMNGRGLEKNDKHLEPQMVVTVNMMIYHGTM